MSHEHQEQASPSSNELWPLPSHAAHSPAQSPAWPAFSPHSPQLQAFFQLSLDLLSARNSDGYYQYLNSAWTTTLGWTLAEVGACSWFEFVHPDDLALTYEVDDRCHQETAIIELQHRFRTPAGHYRWLHWRLSPYADGLSYGIARDITESTWQGSSAYRDSVQETVKLRDRALAASSVGIVIADARLPDMPLIYVNPAFETITGYSAAETLGYNCRFLQGKNTKAQTLEQLRAAVRAGKNCQVQLLNYRKDGTPFWNELTLSPIYDEQQKLTHYIGVQTDISDRIRVESALKKEREKSERLLLNILPDAIVRQLKQRSGAIAEYYQDVPILFADLVGFTLLSERLSPITLVNLLNEIFSEFDRLTEHHRLEKIKTIGDAYMVAAGLTVQQDNPVDSMAQLALNMQAALVQLCHKRGMTLQIRIGINTGSVVAGVIGLKKFIYDLWGDAVNVASRMESSGEPDKIQVTTAIYERLSQDYVFEPRGRIAIKGKGEMFTYWLLGKKSGPPVSIEA